MGGEAVDELAFGRAGIAQEETKESVDTLEPSGGYALAYDLSHGLVRYWPSIRALPIVAVVSNGVKMKGLQE